MFVLGRGVLRVISTEGETKMDGRVGGTKTRMSRSERMSQVKTVVQEQTDRKGYATCTSIARRIGLQPSTYLMGILYDLWVELKIDNDCGVNSKGNKVIHWIGLRHAPE